VTFLAFTASALAIFAEGKYVLSIVRGKTKPNSSGWIIFTVSMACVLASAYTLGARDSLLLIATFACLHFVVALLSLRYGYVRFTRIDISLLLLSGISVILWLQTANPWYALILNVLIDMFGYATIVAKLYQHPETEDSSAWAVSVAAYALNLVVISHWTPQEYLFSLSNVIWCSVISLFALRRRSFNNAPERSPVPRP